MSAGNGVRHSEYNESKTGVAHFLQIWIEPAVAGLAPSYEQKNFPEAEKRGRLRLIASADGADGSVKIHQRARVYVGLFHGAERAQHAPTGGRAYVHVARGSITVGGHRLDAGDAMKTDERALSFADGDQAEVLVFDLP
jgi:redox-sensitive bicupin YhaK (pirin superfamily)